MDKGKAASNVVGGWDKRGKVRGWEGDSGATVAGVRNLGRGKNADSILLDKISLILLHNIQEQLKFILQLH